MKRYLALLKTTWWMWLLYTVASIALMVFVDSSFVFTFALYAIVFVYFAYVRFDEHGNRLE